MTLSNLDRASAVLLGKQPIGMSKSEVRQFVSAELQSLISEEDGCIHEDGSVQEWIEVNEKNVIFWFLNDSLYLFDCFCAWDDDETPRWPKQKGQHTILHATR